MDSFQRNISFEIKPADDNGILVSNTLNDRFHDILLEVIVDKETLQIRELRLDIRKSPSPNCYKVQSKLDLLVGLHIGKGMTSKLFEVLGGSQGCINLRNMLLCSLPLILNVKASEGEEDEEKLLSKVHQKLLGTCVGYSEPPV